jgi:hypothetical protein
MAAGKAGAKRTPTSFPPRPTRGRACPELADGIKEGIDDLNDWNVWNDRNLQILFFDNRFLKELEEKGLAQEVLRQA